MVNGVSNNNNYMNYLQPQISKSRPDPAEMFNKLDTDSSGGLSQSEFEDFILNLPGKTGTSIDAASAVSSYDADGSGELSQDELKSFMEATMPRHGGVMGMGGGNGHKDPFNDIDTDSSEGISQTELETFVQNFSEKTGVSIDATDAVSSYDTDGSGELSKDELKSFMEANSMAPPPPPGGPGMNNEIGSGGESSDTDADSIVSAYDTNGDGVLSSDELQAFLDDSGSSSSFNSLFKQAITAYGANSYGFNAENNFWNFNDFDEYSPVDLSV